MAASSFVSGGVLRARQVQLSAALIRTGGPTFLTVLAPALTRA